MTTLFSAGFNMVGYLPNPDTVHDFDSTTDAWEYILSEIDHAWTESERDGDDALAGEWLEAHTMMHHTDVSQAGEFVAGGMSFWVMPVDHA